MQPNHIFKHRHGSSLVYCLLNSNSHTHDPESDKERIFISDDTDTKRRGISNKMVVPSNE
jgi:hypothetical protein